MLLSAAGCQSKSQRSLEGIRLHEPTRKAFLGTLRKLNHENMRETTKYWPLLWSTTFRGYMLGSVT